VHLGLSISWSQGVELGHVAFVRQLFHWHGLFHSNLGRQLITKEINENKKLLTSSLDNNNSCIYIKNATKIQLLRIAARYMRRGIKNFDKNRNKKTIENNLDKIFEGTKNLNTGGNENQVKFIYNKLFHNYYHKKANFH
jgi:hypothetical protein